MTDNKPMFQYWQNNESTELQKGVNAILKQIMEHKVTRGEIKDMQAAGFSAQLFDDGGGYFVRRPKSCLPSPYYIKVFVTPDDAWQDAYADYAVHELIPKSLERNNK